MLSQIRAKLEPAKATTHLKENPNNNCKIQETQIIASVYRLFTPSDLIAQPEDQPGYISVVFNAKTELVCTNCSKLVYLKYMVWLQILLMYTSCTAAEIKDSVEVILCHFATIKLDLNNSCEPITLTSKQACVCLNKMLIPRALFQTGFSTAELVQLQKNSA